MITPKSRKKASQIKKSGCLTEHQEQVNLVGWAKRMEPMHPELKWLYATPMGHFRDIATAKKIKAEGGKKGVPDLCLPIPRGDYGALYIELKAMDGRASKDQRDWLDGLTMVGNLAIVCKGAEAAKAAILDYLSTTKLP